MPGPATLKDMERPDGIVTVCFRKPEGRVFPLLDYGKDWDPPKL